MPGEGGYEYSQEALTRVTEALRRGAGALDGPALSGFTAPDAGASSEVVGDTLTALLRAAVHHAQDLDKTAGHVHASNGSYHEVENNNTGELRREEQRGYAERNMPLN